MYFQNDLYNQLEKDLYLNFLFQIDLFKKWDLIYHFIIFQNYSKLNFMIKKTPNYYSSFLFSFIFKVLFKSKIFWLIIIDLYYMEHSKLRLLYLIKLIEFIWEYFIKALSFLINFQNFFSIYNFLILKSFFFYYIIHANL